MAMQLSIHVDHGSMVAWWIMVAWWMVGGSPTTLSPPESNDPMPVVQAMLDQATPYIHIQAQAGMQILRFHRTLPKNIVASTV